MLLHIITVAVATWPLWISDTQFLDKVLTNVCSGLLTTILVLQIYIWSFFIIN